MTKELTTWIIADPHLGHEKILGYERTRGVFGTIEEHDNHIIGLWKERVKKRDVVYLMGDIAAHKNALARYRELGGHGLKQTHLILGNHDKLALPNYQELFCSVRMFAEWKGILLTHFPIHPASVRPRYRGNLFGHQHGQASANWAGGQCICPEQLGDFGPVPIESVIPPGWPTVGQWLRARKGKRD